jgi:hypothetical protein
MAGRAGWCAVYGVRHAQKVHIGKGLPGILPIQPISSFRTRRDDASIEIPGSAILLAGGKDLVYATQFIAACLARDLIGPFDLINVSDLGIKIG